MVSDKISRNKAKITGNNFVVQRIDKVVRKSETELRRNALFAVIFFHFIAILIYLAFRFSSFVLVVGAVIALFHDDVRNTIAVIAIFDAIFLNLRFEFNQSMLAASLTLVGFFQMIPLLFLTESENTKIFKNEDIFT